MSVQATSHVWQHSRQKGATLLLLLAIADSAHPDGGGAYPSVASLAKLTRMSGRTVQRLLRELETAGELTIDLGAGPHGCNIYSVTGLSGVTTCQGVTSTATRGCQTEPGGVTKEALGGDIATSPKPRNPIEPNEEIPIRRVAAAPAPDQRVGDVMRSLEDERGYLSEHYAAEAHAVKQLLAHGYTPAEIVACYLWLKQQPWWRDKALTLMSVSTQIGEWRLHKGGHRNGQTAAAPRAAAARGAHPLAAYTGD